MHFYDSQIVFSKVITKFEAWLRARIAYAVLKCVVFYYSAHFPSLFFTCTYAVNLPTVTG